MRGDMRIPGVNERKFWDTFPGLLIDDPEDENNEIIAILRRFALAYFAGETEEVFMERYFEGEVEELLDEYDGTVGV